MCCCSLASNSIRWSALRSSPVFELMLLCGHQNEEKTFFLHVCIKEHQKSILSDYYSIFSIGRMSWRERVRRKIQQTNIYFIQIRILSFSAFFVSYIHKQRSDKRPERECWVVLGWNRSDDDQRGELGDESERRNQIDYSGDWNISRLCHRIARSLSLGHRDKSKEEEGKRKKCCVSQRGNRTPQKSGRWY